MAAFLGIPGSSNWEQLHLLNGGWSHDQKYTFRSKNRKYLLRLSDVSIYERRKKEFEILNAFRDLEVTITKPVSFGLCEDGQSCYTIMTWVDGRDAAKILPTLTSDERYRLGCEAGRILKKIHAVPALEGRPSWSVFFNRKIDRKLDAYKKCGIDVDGADQILAFIQEHRKLLDDRPQSLQHGDYHCGNMVITHKKEIGVIDFDRMDYGDPWEEFNRITWCAGVSPAFAAGRINGYFENEIPNTFFPLMALYIAVNMISSIPWAVDYGEQQINVMKREINRTMVSYDNFQTVVPNWYQL
ncbi:aminoglycoside phosphotransferase family protein [Sporolactobacillus nakayamae]|uniref:Predicted kinase, aminoglycoside phosphotransferase (APT) family n=1 Tax=Sporolactobacillus nakayamae TaxID=269670 RepID=A0A1I2PRY6_9BACL|nr:phosphotransferase family protein [Sporolactobacillus nakayamae]SFG16376.1 Predicted kinase, aminoglycoside phosphotransferase (APT) family [Sporolactobacillus nakayamae]